MLKSSRNFKCSLNHVKLHFIVVLMLSYLAQNADTETVCVQLLKSCYALDVLPLSNSDTSMIKHVIDRALYTHCGDADDIQYIYDWLWICLLSKCVFLLDSRSFEELCL